uniref:Protein kinase domain-containing protein n=1 Tax=Spongospora subterranea TaxID=70186 RepID=A0A0H5RC11_9EUKA|eukprot:CRZ11573.1 hypothetical protein [Spongospora subterranea]
MDPEHIALDSAGHVVITDFRIALDANNNDQPCRNPEYRTPEYLNGQREGSEADWWRLGVLIYELLVGFPPFRDQDPTELNNKILSVSIRYPPFVSTAACDIISKLIEVDINKRLGCGRNGFSEIIQHQFFADVNWSLVDRRNQPVPPIVLQCIESIDKGKPA